MFVQYLRPAICHFPSQNLVNMDLYAGDYIIVDYTDLSGKNPYRQVGMGTVVTSGSLGSVMVSRLAHNVRYVSLIPALGTILPISTHLWYWFP